MSDMYERGFGTGHMLDLRPIQVQMKDESIHNILHEITAAGTLVDAGEPVAVTMCGLRLDDEGEPYQGGPTNCAQCGLLAAWHVVSDRTRGSWI